MKEISLGIILPPRAVTRIIALRFPLTLTSPVGKERRREEEEEPLSGEEGGVRVCREDEDEVREEGEEERSEIFTVSCSLRLATGDTWLLFSIFTVGEKGGVSPSKEWMEEVEDE